MKFDKIWIQAPRTMSACILLGLCNGFGGCWTPCEVDHTEIIVDGESIPKVPDQHVGGCFEVRIGRTYSNDAELDLILRAESLASTIGPEWFSATQTPPISGMGYPEIPPFLIPDALNEDALYDYAQRLRSLQTGELSGLAKASLTYSVLIIKPTEATANDAVNATTVFMQLEYWEAWGVISSIGLGARREVTFNQSGEVVEVRYDGEAGFSVVN